MSAEVSKDSIKRIQATAASAGRWRPDVAQRLRRGGH